MISTGRGIILTCPGFGIGMVNVDVLYFDDE